MFNFDNLPVIGFMLKMSGPTTTAWISQLRRRFSAFLLAFGRNKSPISPQIFYLTKLCVRPQVNLQSDCSDLRLRSMSMLTSSKEVTGRCSAQTGSQFKSNYKNLRLLRGCHVSSAFFCRLALKMGSVKNTPQLSFPWEIWLMLVFLFF